MCHYSVAKDENDDWSITMNAGYNCGKSCE